MAISINSLKLDQIHQTLVAAEVEKLVRKLKIISEMWTLIVGTTFVITSVLCQGGDIAPGTRSLRQRYDRVSKSMKPGYSDNDSWGTSSSSTHEDQKTENSLTASSDLKPTEIAVIPGRSPPQRSKRNIINLYGMMKCSTPCCPYNYIGYGCYCGLSGEYSGLAVDGIDRCCQEHDRCYTRTNCFAYAEYWAPYDWDCYSGREPKCDDGRGFWSWVYSIFGGFSCPQRACRCDRAFAKCLQKYPCPRTKPACVRQW